MQSPHSLQILYAKRICNRKLLEHVSQWQREEQEMHAEAIDFRGREIKVLL